MRGLLVASGTVVVTLFVACGSFTGAGGSENLDAEAPASDAPGVTDGGLDAAIAPLDAAPGLPDGTTPIQDPLLLPRMSPSLAVGCSDSDDFYEAFEVPTFGPGVIHVALDRKTETRAAVVRVGQSADALGSIEFYERPAGGAPFAAMPALYSGGKPAPCGAVSLNTDGSSLLFDGAVNAAPGFGSARVKWVDAGVAVTPQSTRPYSNSGRTDLTDPQWFDTFAYGSVGRESGAPQVAHLNPSNSPVLLFGNQSAFSPVTNSKLKELFYTRKDVTPPQLARATGDADHDWETSNLPVAMAAGTSQNKRPMFLSEDNCRLLVIDLSTRVVTLLNRRK